MNAPDFSFKELPNGFSLTLDTANYLMTWVGDKLMITGPDICYYLLETARGLEQANCALTTFTILIPQ